MKTRYLLRIDSTVSPELQVSILSHISFCHGAKVYVFGWLVRSVKRVRFVPVTKTMCLCELVRTIDNKYDLNLPQIWTTGLQWQTPIVLHHCRGQCQIIKSLHVLLNLFSYVTNSLPPSLFLSLSLFFPPSPSLLPTDVAEKNVLNVNRV